MLLLYWAGCPIISNSRDIILPGALGAQADISYNLQTEVGSLCKKEQSMKVQNKRFDLDQNEGRPSSESNQQAEICGTNRRQERLAWRAGLGLSALLLWPMFNPDWELRSHVAMVQPKKEAERLASAKPIAEGNRTFKGMKEEGTVVGASC